MVHNAPFAHVLNPFAQQRILISMQLDVVVDRLVDEIATRPVLGSRHMSRFCPATQSRSFALLRMTILKNKEPHPGKDAGMGHFETCFTQPATGAAVTDWSCFAISLRSATLSGLSSSLMRAWFTAATMIRPASVLTLPKMPSRCIFSAWCWLSSVGLR